MSSITVEPFRPEQAAEASRVLARAFASNPAHVAAFGSPAPLKNEAFFRTVLTVTKGPKFVATDGSRIFGLIHWVHSSECQVSPGEKLRRLPVMTAKLGIAATLRVLSWLSMWSKHDPKASHLHLGPIGVAPEAQGQRIGYRLMTRYCEALAVSAVSGYLETDRPENVGFYRQFGFETTEEIQVIGVKNYLMWRPVTSDQRQ